MKGSAEEGPSGVALLGAGCALLIALCMVVGLLVVIIDDDDNCGLDAVPASSVDVPTKPVPVANRNAPLTARIATWNTLYTNSTPRVLSGLKALTRAADVIGAQELFAAARRKAAAQTLASQGWATVVGADSAVPIFYNAAKYKLLAHDTVKEFDVTRIEAGASGTSIGPRWLQWVQLQDRSTGAVLFVVNDHIIPDIDRAGHPRSGAPKRIAIYQQQRAIAASVIAKLRVYGPVAFTEDSNIDARADQRVQHAGFDYARMRRAGMASNWTALGMPDRGTQVTGRRLIDKVWLTQENGRFLRQTELPAYGSDHHPQVVTVANRPQAAGPASSTGPAVGQRQLPTSLTVPGLTLDAEQIKIAATAIEVGKQFDIPERGWIVAIASGLQESGLHNLPGGDRDSAGWQQQRPSAGWGTLAQIQNVRLATMAFYGVADHTHNRGLTDVKGWQQMSIAAAAQAVQVSAFPTAYAKWEAPATAIVEKLADLAGTGSTGDGCGSTGDGALNGGCPPTTMSAEKALSHDALLVLRCVAAQFPTIHDISTHPGHLPDESRAVDIMIPDWQTPAGKAAGGRIAAWVKSHQRELGVQYVIWNARIWSVERDSDGWRTYTGITGGEDASSLHYNHVHVSVYGNRGTGPAGEAETAAGTWHSPLGQPFRVGCGFGCYPGHTGQDFPAPTGTPVYAVTNGTVIRSESITTAGACATLPICGGAKISYGNLLVVRLTGGGDVTAWYAHLTERRVRAGDTVRAGQIIGTVGYQGHVIPQGPRGAHLHFEIRRGGTPINPLPYLRSKGIQP